MKIWADDSWWNLLGVVHPSLWSHRTYFHACSIGWLWFPLPLHPWGGVTLFATDHKVFEADQLTGDRHLIGKKTHQGVKINGCNFGVTPCHKKAPESQFGPLLVGWCLANLAIVLCNQALVVLGCIYGQLFSSSEVWIHPLPGVSCGVLRIGSCALPKTGAGHGTKRNHKITVPSSKSWGCFKAW